MSELDPITHAARLHAFGLPDVVERIATEGGASVHPLLRDQADSVWAPQWAVVADHPDLLPLWGHGTVGNFVSSDGTFTKRDAEVPDEPLKTYPDFTMVVRDLLTDIFELDDAGRHEQARRELAHLLLPRRTPSRRWSRSSGEPAHEVNSRIWLPCRPGTCRSPHPSTGTRGVPESPDPWRTCEDLTPALAAPREWGALVVLT